ncbi:MAG: tRNA pseudouridine(55) synthase TruB [Candidatus Magasanikbacteria bacterium]
MDGLLLINKPLDLTSHDVVEEVRKIKNINKAGHIGTLDPTAEGLLGILINKATKISQFLVGFDKKYKIQAKFGKQTDTLDQAGEVIKTCNADKIDKEKIQKVVSELEGSIKQKPPKYSAIKKDGKKLYEYARDEEQVEIPTREVEIKYLQLEEFDEKEKKMTLDLHCSSGTYTRSIVRDIAKKLNSCAYQTRLKRYEIGNFNLTQALSISECKQNAKSGVLKESIVSINQALRFLPKVTIKENARKFAKNGTQLRPKNFVKTPNLEPGTKVRVNDESNNVLVVGKILKNPDTSRANEEVLGYETVLS